ncbi:hypothetical protein ACR42D_04235 [Desulfovibrio caledoniensis]
MKSVNIIPIIIKIPFLFVIFLLAVAAWSFIWMLYFEYLIWHFYYVVPTFAASLFLSAVIGFYAPRLRIVPAIVWAGPIALFLLFSVTWIASSILSTTSTFYFGMDITTTRGIRTCTSMVQTTHYTLPRWLQQFLVRPPSLKAEAIYCDLGEDKNLIATLAFDRDYGGIHTLNKLSDALNEYTENNSTQGPQSHRIRLAGQQIPILVTASTPRDPTTMIRVLPDKVTNILGATYSLKSIWVEKTDNLFEYSGIEKHIPWIITDDFIEEANIRSLLKKADLEGAVKPFKK